MDSLYRDFGQRVRRQRQRAGLTQGQLATRVGLTRTSITNIEKGTQHIPLHLLFDLARAVGVDPAQLLPDPSPEGTVTLPDNVMRALSERDQEWVVKVVRAGKRPLQEGGVDEQA